MDRLVYQEKQAKRLPRLLSFALAVLLAFLIGGAVQQLVCASPSCLLRLCHYSLSHYCRRVWVSGGDNNIFTQIGFVVLVGWRPERHLIVEFARAKEHDSDPR